MNAKVMIVVNLNENEVEEEEERVVLEEWFLKAIVLVYLIFVN